MGKHIRKKRVILPSGYRSYLGLKETEKAIKLIKDHFQTQLAKALNLQRISAPLFVPKRTGINDYLSGNERPVGFIIKDSGEPAEIVQSLAKWKRAALMDYGFRSGEGLYTDMNAIRPDEALDSLHSVYVDQWDWERIIGRKDRNIPFLTMIVRLIYEAIRTTERTVCKRYRSLPRPFLPEDIYFIHSEDLEEKYPRLTPEEREHEICKEKGAVFVIGIGHERAADYDDWSTETERGHRGLNGDIICWYPPLACAIELSSMGIRVDKKALIRQCELRGETKKLGLDFHQRLIHGELPLTMGGGIGQSRLCMFFLRKAHIGEVQSSIWPDRMRKAFKRHNVVLL